MSPQSAPQPALFTRSAPAPTLYPDARSTRSRRCIGALLELPQFSPFAPAADNWYAVHTLSGAHVYPLETVQDSGMLLIRFSGAMPGVEVYGQQYLRLQVCEAVAHLAHCPENGQGDLGAQAHALMHRLRLEHDLG